MILDVEQKMRALAWYARSWVGTTEQGGNNKGQIVETMQKLVDGVAVAQAWCAIFASFCVMRIDDLASAMAQADLPRALLKSTDNTNTLFAQTPPEAHTDTPSPGCIVVWSKLGPDGKPVWEGHCGVVFDVRDDIVMTVEGNTSQPADGDQREGDGVWLKARRNGDIPGFVRRGYLLPWGK